MRRLQSIILHHEGLIDHREGMQLYMLVAHSSSSIFIPIVANPMCSKDNMFEPLSWLHLHISTPIIAHQSMQGSKVDFCVRKFSKSKVEKNSPGNGRYAETTPPNIRLSKGVACEIYSVVIVPRQAGTGMSGLGMGKGKG